MGRVNFVQALPPEIATELNRRLLFNGFSGYQELADWLTSKGFPCSKSAVHRYGVHMEAALSCEGSGADEYRMRCLEVAASIATGDDLLDVAEDLLFWVTTGKRV